MKTPKNVQEMLPKSKIFTKVKRAQWQSKNKSRFSSKCKVVTPVDPTTFLLQPIKYPKRDNIKS